MIVLDTNVLSELMRATPAPAVVVWVGSRTPAELVTTAICVAEIRYGIARLDAGRRRRSLEDAADEVFGMFAHAVLPFDAEAARRYPAVVLERERSGAPVSGFDAQIAAVCRANDAGLATRNPADFAGLGLDVVDPWDA